MGQFAAFNNDILQVCERDFQSVSVCLSVFTSLFAVITTICDSRHLNYGQVCFLSFNFVAQMLTLTTRESPGGAVQEVWGILRCFKSFILLLFGIFLFKTKLTKRMIVFIWTAPSTFSNNSIITITTEGRYSVCSKQR